MPGEWPWYKQVTDCDVHVFKWIWNHYSVIHHNETCAVVGFLCVQFLLSFSAHVKGNKVRDVEMQHCWFFVNLFLCMFCKKTPWR